MFQSPPKGVTVPYTPLKAVAVSGLGGVSNLNNLPGLPTIFPTSQAILPTQTISQAQVTLLVLQSVPEKNPLLPWRLVSQLLGYQITKPRPPLEMGSKELFKTHPDMSKIYILANYQLQYYS